MKFYFVVLLAIAATVSFARTEENSYLEYRADSVASLVHEVDTSMVVADRYMRHYAMTQGQVEAMFRTYHITTLATRTDVIMYSVPEAGFIKSHRVTLHAGTKVFADASGQFQIRVSCGNPIVPYGSSDFDRSTPVGGNVGGSKDLVAMTSPSALPSVMAPDAVALIPALPIVPEAPAISQQVVPITPLITSTRSSALFPLLIGVGALIGTINHHSSPPQPAPAPAGFIVLAVPAITVFIKRRNR